MNKKIFKNNKYNKIFLSSFKVIMSTVTSETFTFATSAE